MSSIRNAPVDIASARILHYLRTHNYDDCAIYINRLSPNTFRKILSSDLSIDILLAQLPFSIEIFEVIYSKIFINDPDTFPLRILKPEGLLSKMISIFASTNIATEKSVASKIPGIDDERLLSNLASILRIISYVQPILFKRLLRQKETIDECILHVEQRHSTATTQTSTTNLRRLSSTSLPSTNTTLEETLRSELETTIVCCQQALHKLQTKTATTPLSPTLSSAHSTPIVKKKRNSMHTSISTLSSTPCSLDDIQNRLFQHKAILNLIEPYLSRTKLYTLVNNLTNKVSIDKQILLAYSHVKIHEKQIPFSEPLLPLFKRFAFAYERIIQLWRRVTDSTLIDECTDDIVIDDTTGIGSGVCFERARSQEPRPCRSRYETELLFYKDDMALKNEQSTPLQPLAINGREQRSRMLTNGPSSSILPPTTSLSSLSPLITTQNNPSSTANVMFTTLSPNLQQQQTTNGHKSNVHQTGNLLLTTNDQESDERERLKNDVQQLKNELQKSKETIARLQKSEEQMRERLAEQAQRQLEKGGKFEDLNQISRPTELIRAYNSLYSQARIDALDALDNVREMSDAEDLKSKLLFSVVVLAFRHAQIHAKEIRTKIKQILQFTGDKSSMILEETIEKYLRSTIQKYDIGKIAFEVETQLWTTLYDYPALKSCNELLKYITQACRTAWGLVNQTPAFYIEFQSSKYDRQLHERFHTSDNESETIVEYVWPCLIDGRDRMCVAKGVVITDERYASKIITALS